MCQLLLLHCLRISGVLVSVYMVSLPINYHYFSIDCDMIIIVITGTVICKLLLLVFTIVCWVGIKVYYQLIIIVVIMSQSILT